MVRKHCMIFQFFYLIYIEPITVHQQLVKLLDFFRTHVQGYRSMPGFIFWRDFDAHSRLCRLAAADKKTFLSFRRDGDQGARGENGRPQD